ncbi:hypothetical protein ACFPRL_04605 [Pseudoclavibacter helvolus]
MEVACMVIRSFKETHRMPSAAQRGVPRQGARNGDPGGSEQPATARSEDLNTRSSSTSAEGLLSR